MPLIIPNRDTKRWTQPNKSDIFGTLQQTKNIDFDIDGYARLAKRVRTIYTEDNDANFVRATAICFYDTGSTYFISTADHLFKMVLAEAMALADASGDSNAPAMDSAGYSDLINWQGYVYCSGDASSNLRRYDGSWSGSQYDLSMGGPMCVHEQKNALAIGQGNTVLLLDTSHVLLVTLTLNSNYFVTSVDYNNGFIYVGTRHTSNGEAFLFQWDGNTAVANGGWGVGTHRIGSVKKYQSTVAITTSDGLLQKFNGGGFDTLANLRIFYTDLDWDRAGNSNEGRVIHRGMVVEGDLIFIHLSPRLNIVSTAVNDPLLYNWFPGGVMCFDPKVGLYHRYPNSSSLRSRSNTVSTASVNTTTNVITIAGTTVPVTGTPVIYDAAGSTAIAGLSDGKKYYVIYVSATTMKLATSLANASAGTAIDLTGTGNNSQVFNFLPNRDFGGTAIVGGDSALTDSSSAIALMKPGNSANVRGSTARRVMFGGKMGTSVVAEKYTIQVATENQENRGYLITTRVSATALSDVFQNFAIKWKGINTPEDKIVPKFRTTERDDDFGILSSRLLQTGTWTGLLGNSFNTSADLTDALVGDEVEIVNGAGAGYLAHITLLTYEPVGGTWGVEIDENVQNVSPADTMLFFINNWSKAGDAITEEDNDLFKTENDDEYSSTGGYKDYPVNENAKWLEIKLELRGEDVEIEEIFINNVPLRQFI